MNNKNPAVEASSCFCCQALKHTPHSILLPDHLTEVAPEQRGLVSVKPAELTLYTCSHCGSLWFYSQVRQWFMQYVPVRTGDIE